MFYDLALAEFYKEAPSVHETVIRRQLERALQKVPTGRQPELRQQSQEAVQGRFGTPGDIGR